MVVYSCRNCSNLKTRVIAKGSLKSLKREKIRKALDIRDTESLGLDFPFNPSQKSPGFNPWDECIVLSAQEEAPGFSPGSFTLTVYKRINKDGECKIIYCSEHMLNRDLYIYRYSLDLHSLSQDKNKPCVKYK